MVIVKFINRSSRNLKEVLYYVASDDRVNSRDENSPVFMGGIADNPEDANMRMEIVKKLWNKTGGRTYIHLTIDGKKQMAINVKHKTDIKPMVTYVDKDGYLPLSEDKIKKKNKYM
ncbi:MAG: hypothetical protein Q4G33_15405 [bacterium]|nr:hypothetical protein [bacterium]